MLPYQFPFPFISTIEIRNKTFPADVLEPELSNILPKSGTFYNFTIDTISTCTICTLTVTYALFTL